LKWQFDWAGASLINKRILVCDTCYDTPQEQLRAIVLPPDPVPIINPRIEYFVDDETNYQTISQPTQYDPVSGIPIPPSTVLLTQDGQNMTELPYGQPTGLEPYAIAPLINKEQYNVTIPVLSVFSNGSTIIQVTCSSPHGLVTNSQIYVEGLNNPLAQGLFSVNVTTATAFNYVTYSAIPLGSLQTGTTLVATTLVGLPYGYNQIPQVGP
jgi:hypothetical protein